MKIRDAMCWGWVVLLLLSISDLDVAPKVADVDLQQKPIPPSILYRRRHGSIDLGAPEPAKSWKTTLAS